MKYAGKVTGKRTDQGDWQLTHFRGSPNSITLDHSRYYSLDKGQRILYSTEDGKKWGRAYKYLPLAEHLVNQIQGFDSVISTEFHFERGNRPGSNVQRNLAENLTSSISQWFREFYRKNVNSFAIYDPADISPSPRMLTIEEDPPNEKKVVQILSELNYYGSTIEIVPPYRPGISLQVLSGSDTFRNVMNQHPIESGLFFLPIHNFFERKGDINPDKNLIYRVLAERFEEM